MKFTAAAAMALTAGSVFAQGLPDQMKWMAYPTDSDGYAQAVAIGNMLKERAGSRVAVLPGQNDIARLTPVKNGQADYCMCGIAAYFALEGATDFATPDWGPQKMRLILAKISDSGLGVATRSDAGIESAADFRGKRIPDVKAAAALNVPMNAILAFGGLSRDDVETVEFSGFSASWEAVINNQSDAAFATTVTPTSAQLAASPGGIRWIPLPHDDKEGWARLKAAAPYMAPHVVKVASGLGEGESFEGATYPYPFLVASPRVDDDAAYELTKAMIEHLDDYRDAAPGADGWALEAQKMEWVIPFHPGAIRYFREAGVWTDALEAHNADLLAREKVLQEAWDGFDKAVAGEGEAFASAWMGARKAALEAAGLPVIFD